MSSIITKEWRRWATLLRLRSQLELGKNGEGNPIRIRAADILLGALNEKALKKLSKNKVVYVRKSCNQDPLPPLEEAIVDIARDAGIVVDFLIKGGGSTPYISITGLHRFR